MFEKVLSKNTAGGSAVFLDRDGTINASGGFIVRPKTLGLERNAAAGIKKINSLGLPAIVVTNQPWVARGLFGECDVEAVNTRLIGLLAEKGARIDAVYWCPHSRLADLPEYRKDCRYRKPSTGMLEAAAERFGLELKSCFMVGDSVRDVLAGQRAGCTTIGVETGDGCSDRRDDVEEGIKPQHMARDLLDAAGIIESLLKGGKGK